LYSLVSRIPSGLAQTQFVKSDRLLGATASLFPADEIILGDLPCVCCALNGFDEARTWLGNAIDAGGNETKLRALDDPDSEDWKEFGRT
jgi:hypothetical protein